MSILKNGLYHSDCLVLLERLPDRSIDLIYVDPPWNSPHQLAKEDEAYITFMRRVIRQFRRVLAPTGNLLMHISPESGLYIRPLLEEVFDRTLYQPEISIPIKRHFSSRIMKSRAGHEIILHYAASSNNTYNRQTAMLAKHEALELGFKEDEDGRLFLSEPLTSPFLREQRPNMYFEFRGYFPREGRTWRYTLAALNELNEQGKIHQSSPGHPPTLKHYLDEHPGIDVTDDWIDMPLIDYSPKHRHISGQRPIVLMNKLLSIASNPGDLVLDVFCGTGATLVSAENNNRRWIGCDLDPEAYAAAKQRLKEECNVTFGTGYLTGDEAHLKSEYSVIRSSITPKVFISYSRRDEVEFVQPYLQKFDVEMIDYWLDRRDIEVGDLWREKLAEGLKECDAMILFITPASLDSEYVQEEYQAFLDAGKQIYPVLCKETHIPRELKEIQYVLHTEPEKLLDKLRKHKMKQ